jgi:hypothetical protein
LGDDYVDYEAIAGAPDTEVDTENVGVSTPGMQVRKSRKLYIPRITFCLEIGILWGRELFFVYQFCKIMAIYCFFALTSGVKVFEISIKMSL